MTMIHPMVRDLYKRVLIVSKDYPTTDHQHHIKQIWKTALRNPQNCPSWYPATTTTTTTTTTNQSNNDLDELHFAVHRGRQMVQEMMGIVQLHKYRTMKQRYYNNNNDNDTNMIQESIAKIVSSSSSSSTDQQWTPYSATNSNNPITTTTTTTNKLKDYVQQRS